MLKHCTIEIYGGIMVKLHIFLTLALGGGKG
jgi:hypothetical protein